MLNLNKDTYSELTTGKLKEIIKDIFDGQQHSSQGQWLITTRNGLIDILVEKFELDNTEEDIQNYRNSLDPDYFYFVHFSREFFEMYRIEDGRSVPINVPNVYEWI